MGKKREEVIREEEFSKEVEATRSNLMYRLMKDIPLGSYKEVAHYLATMMNAHRLKVVSKDDLTAATYAGGVLLQAIKMAKMEDDVGGQLTATFHHQSVALRMSPEQAKQIVMAGSQSLQITMLKRLEEQGNVVEAGAVREVPDEDIKRLEPITPEEKKADVVIQRAEAMQAAEETFFD